MALLLGVSFSGRILAQEPLRRPTLPEGADSASAQAHFDYGVELLVKDPDRAAEHFHWANLLQPDWSEPLDGWRAALLVREAHRLGDYMSAGRRTDTQRMADSLRYQAEIRNPFQYRQFESTLVESYLRSRARQIDPTGNTAGEIEFLFDQVMRSASDWNKAWRAYSNHELKYALELYERAIKNASKFDQGYLHAERAHVYAVAGMYAEARAEYAASVAQLRETDETMLLPFYESKALQQYAMGVLAELMENPERARNDFRLALEEDLSFHPAHEGLARLALADGDTAQALSEYRLAADLVPNEPAVRMKLVGMLTLTGDIAGAETEAAAAAASDPVYAQPHLVLGALSDRQGKRTEALTHYARFLELAARGDRSRATVQNRVAALKAAGG